MFLYSCGNIWSKISFAFSHSCSFELSLICLGFWLVVAFPSFSSAAFLVVGVVVSCSVVSGGIQV